MVQPRVAAIIPAYNAEEFIERTLLSAVGQTYSKLQVLVIDDGSTDRTAEIVRGVAERFDNIELLSIPNSGVAAARNHGIEQADAHYVAFLDADDLWEPTKIEKQVAALARHGHSREWAGCYGLLRYINLRDEVLDDGFAWKSRGDFLEEQIVSNPIGNGSNLLVRRDVALEVGGFNPEYAQQGIGGCEDLEFQLRILRQHKIEVVREYLGGYRLHDEQMSRDLVRMRLSQIAVVRKIAEVGIPAKIRTRGLVQAYLIAAKGYLLVGNWREALKWLWAGLRESPAASARKIWRQARYEFGYWATRLVQSVRYAGAEPAPARLFADMAPEEGVEADRRGIAPYRISVREGSRVRSDAKHAASKGES